MNKNTALIFIGMIILMTFVVSAEEVINNTSQNTTQTCTTECHCGMKEIEYSICTLSNCSSIHIPCENGCDNVIGKCRTQVNPEASEKVTCFFMNSDERHDCFYNSRTGGEQGCSGTGNCTADSSGFRYDILTWNSDCFGEAKTLLDGADEKVYFDCNPNKCKTLGLRETGRYCSGDNSWNNQKGNQDACENNFECSSNLCIDNQCVDSGLFSRIIRWFQKLFG